MDGFHFKNLFHRDKPSLGGDFEERRKNLRTIPEQGTQVLIIEDSKTVQHVMQGMLRQGKFSILQAMDGETGLHMAREHKPDLIIMDVVLPGINGFQATRRLRQDAATRDIPIIIMSGNEQATAQFWVLKIGANDFMIKPFSRGDLFRRIERLLYKNEVA